MTKSKFLFITAFFIFSTSLFAQDNFQEVGMALRDEFNMGFVYKIQKSENQYTAYDLLFANIGTFSNSNSTSATFSAGGSITFEKRKDIDEKAKFLHGWSPGLSVSITSAGDTNVTQIIPGLGYRLGFLYQFSEQFYASLQGQIRSSASFLIGTDSGTPTTFNIGFSQQDVTLNLVYRFKKKQ